ncbi:MAG: DUF2147 domain-containing protein, partial [Burkholderiaceae bacterium]|nr:DUF2147 domain-containing protein [Burkholderiaceae bacterium]
MRAWAGALACALACVWLLTLPSGAARSAEATAAPDPHESRNSPVGLWQTISDSDGKPRGLVQIRDHDGVLSGRIVGTLRADESPDARCERCPGERKGQKLLGMTILSGLRRQGDGAQARWTGGEILDPDNGRSYDVTLTL